MDPKNDNFVCDLYEIHYCCWAMDTVAVSIILYELSCTLPEVNFDDI